MRTTDSVFYTRLLGNRSAVPLDHPRRAQSVRQLCKRAVGAYTHSELDVQYIHEAIETPRGEDDVSVEALKVELRGALKTGAFDSTHMTMRLLSPGCNICKKCTLQSRLRH